MGGKIGLSCSTLVFGTLRVILYRKKRQCGSRISAVDVTMVTCKKRKYIPHLLKFLLPYAPERVYRFGSWARDEADELSDLDIVIIKRTPLPFLDRIREVLSLLPRELGAVDVLVYTPEEWTRMKEAGNAFAEMVDL